MERSTELLSTRARIVAGLLAVAAIAGYCAATDESQAELVLPEAACVTLPEATHLEVVTPELPEDVHEHEDREREPIRTFSILHTVSEGENLSAIAECYFEQPDIGLSSILKSNPTIANPDEIAIGQIVTINITTATQVKLNEDISTEDIAEQTGYEQSVIEKINGANELEAGSRLSLPLQQSVLTDQSTELYVVNQGDTLSGIARRAGISLVDLLNLNAGAVPSAKELKPGHLLVAPREPKAIPNDAIESPYRSVEQKIKTFVEEYGKIAKETADKYGLPYEAIVAQAIKETGYGSSELANNANNMFGMKVKEGWDGRVYNKVTTEEINADDLESWSNVKSVRELRNGNLEIRISQPFRAYGSIADSFDDYGRWVTESGYYDDAAQDEDPFDYADSLVDEPTYTGEGRWATDSNYAEEIKNIIENLRAVENRTDTSENSPTTTEAQESVEPSIREKIEAVELSVEGYEAFKKSINRDYIDFAETKPAFTKENGVDQSRGTELFNMHFTTLYVNQEGGTDKPQGDVDVERLISSMDNQGDGSETKCCAVQWFIDRNGVAYQLVRDINTKLVHNPPFNEVSTGVEVESDLQENITTKQYETLMYLSTYVLEQQGLLGKAPLESILQGHGEQREMLRANGSTLNYRSDFPEAESVLVRRQMIDFLQALGYYN